MRASIIQSLGTLEQHQKKPSQVGRPKLPKGHAKGRIVPVRFKAEDMKRVEAAAKAVDGFGMDSEHVECCHHFYLAPTLNCAKAQA